MWQVQHIRAPDSSRGGDASHSTASVTLWLKGLSDCLPICTSDAACNRTFYSITQVRIRIFRVLLYLSFVVIKGPIRNWVWRKESEVELVHAEWYMNTSSALKLVKDLNREFHLNNDTYKLNFYRTDSMLHLNYKTSWLLIFMKTVAVYFEILPSIHPRHYSLFWVVSSLRRRLYFSLCSARLLHLRIPRTRDVSLRTTSFQFVLGFQIPLKPIRNTLIMLCGQGTRFLKVKASVTNQNVARDYVLLVNEGGRLLINLQQRN